MMEVKIMAEPTEDSKDSEDGEYGPFEKWEIESAVRTLLEAEEIKADPEKMKYVKMCMEEKYGAVKKAINSLSDLKAVAKEKLDKSADNESD
jgi:hypothetical protein